MFARISQFLRSHQQSLVPSLAALAMAFTWATAGAAQAAPKPTANDDWTRALQAPHRQLFDAPAPEGGIPLVHVMNYYDTYNREFGITDRQVQGVLTFYGRTTFFGLSDEMWAKYRLGEFLKENDASGQPATKNPWRVAPQILGMSMPNASIEALQARGGTFILCNNALGIFAGLVANARGLEQKTVYADMRAHVLPQVTVVPAMVIAIEQAHRAGLSYHRQ